MSKPRVWDGSAAEGREAQRHVGEGEDETK